MVSGVVVWCLVSARIHPVKGGGTSSSFFHPLFFSSSSFFLPQSSRSKQSPKGSSKILFNDLGTARWRECWSHSRGGGVRQASPLLSSRLAVPSSHAFCCCCLRAASSFLCRQAMVKVRDRRPYVSSGRKRRGRERWKAARMFRGGRP